MIRHPGQLEQRKIPQGNRSIKFPEWLSGFGSHREYVSSSQKQLQSIIIIESYVDIILTDKKGVVLNL